MLLVSPTAVSAIARGLSSGDAVAAVAHAMAMGDVRPGATVAVKIQYPDALAMMSQGAAHEGLLIF